MTKKVITQTFKRGIVRRQKGIFRGNLCVAQSEEGIVEIIQSPIEFALETSFTEERLWQDMGIVVGFVLNHPEVFKTPSGGNYAS